MRKFAATQPLTPAHASLGDEDFERAAHTILAAELAAAQATRTGPVVWEVYRPAFPFFTMDDGTKVPNLPVLRAMCEATPNTSL